MKIDDYWDVGKATLQDPGKFLESLYKYDRVSAKWRACGCGLTWASLAHQYMPEMRLKIVRREQVA